MRKAQVNSNGAALDGMAARKLERTVTTIHRVLDARLTFIAAILPAAARQWAKASVLAYGQLDSTFGNPGPVPAPIHITYAGESEQAESQLDEREILEAFAAFAGSRGRMPGTAQSILKTLQQNRATPLLPAAGALPDQDGEDEALTVLESADAYVDYWLHQQVWVSGGDDPMLRFYANEQYEFSIDVDLTEDAFVSAAMASYRQLAELLHGQTADFFDHLAKANKLPDLTPWRERVTAQQLAAPTRDVQTIDLAYFVDGILDDRAAFATDDDFGQTVL